VDTIRRDFTRTVTKTTGVQARYSKTCNSVRIAFWYKRIECRETLAIDPTPSNIKYASRLRGEIINAIERNTFCYADYFPESNKAKQFGHVSSRLTIGELLTQFLARVKTTQQPSTYTTYSKGCAAHLMPVFGSILLTELTPMILREWVSSLALTRKTVSNILIPLRAILDEAVNDDLIERNPLERVVLGKLLNKQTINSAYAPDPFDQQERQAILQAASKQARPFFQFAFYSGLRPSELIALEWPDVEWAQNRVHVQRAVVEKKEKCTKTRAGNRFLTLLQPARQALEAQKVHTFRSSKRVFHNPFTGRAWETDGQIRETCWKPLLKQAGVRYRNPYQTRHTYASMLLSAGENMLWVAKQMGHTDTEMVMKVYGKWIPNTNLDSGYQTVKDWSQDC
jgi:integrase